MKQALVFGAYGGIGLAVVSELLKAGYKVKPVGRDNIDFCDTESRWHIVKLLNDYDPDVVINCAGVFDDNDGDYYKTMDVNVASNWHIIKYYLNYTAKPISINFVGSSAYKAGKKNYMLYSASKAALHNLWEGSRDFFAGSKITVNIVHPVRTRTKMVAPYDDKLDYLSPEEVATVIAELAQSNTSSCKEITFKE